LFHCKTPPLSEPLPKKILLAVLKPKILEPTEPLWKWFVFSKKVG
jgi:hypothetical protein